MKMSPDQIQQKKARLAELKAMKSNPKVQEQDMLYKISQSIGVQAALGAGDLLKNQTNALASLLTGGEIPYKETKSGSGPSYDTGKLGMEMAEVMIPATWPGRIAAGTGMSILGNPENPKEAAGTGLAFSLAGEAVSPALKGAGSLFRNQLVEPLSLDKYSAEVSNYIKNLFTEIEDRTWGQLRPIMDEHGGKRLLEPGVYGEISSPSFMAFKELTEGKKSKKLFTSGFDKVKGEFDKAPTIDNAQKMIKQLGEDERKIWNSLDTDKNTKEKTYHEAKNLLRDTLRPRMEKLSPGFTEKYNEANKGFAIGAGPIITGKNMQSAAAGNTERAEAIYSEIGNLSKEKFRGRPAIGPESELLDLYKKMGTKVGVSEMVPQGPAKFVPLLGTPTSRETTYQFAQKGEQALSPYLRALLQSQNVPGAK